MKVLKKIFNFYIHSSVHVALSVMALTWVTALDLQISCDKHLLFFVFFATITAYNFVKYFGVAKFHHRSLTTKLKAIQIFSFFCFILMCYYALQLSLKTLYYIGGFGLVTFLYAIPFIPKRYFIDQQMNLRSVVGLKIYLIALVWTGVTVFLPVMEHDLYVNQTVIIMAIQRFLFVMVLMLPFEIRDLQYDSLKLSTLPQQIGVTPTKYIGGLLLVIILLLDYGLLEGNLFSRSVLFVIIMTTFVLLILARRQQSQYYSSFWVEAIPILWLILRLIENY